MAMDELERAMLDTRVNPACSTRIFLHMMPELTAVPKQVVAEWKTVSPSVGKLHVGNSLWGCVEVSSTRTAGFFV